MKHVVLDIDSTHQFGQDLLKYKEFKNAKSVFVMIYTAYLDKDWTRALYQTVLSVFPTATVIAIRAPKVLSPTHFMSQHTVCSLLVLEHSSVSIQLLPIEPGEEAQLSGRLCTSVCHASELKGLMMLSTAGDLHAHELFNTILEKAAPTPVFGGIVGNLDNFNDSWIFANGEFCFSGLLLIALAGQNLRIHTYNYLGWLPFGEPLTITKGSDRRVYEINNQKAFRIYQYFIATERENFPIAALEFPLIMQRGPHAIARVALEVCPDDSLIFASDLNEGDQVRLGYGDINKIVANLDFSYQELEQFQPEAIINVSCCSRQHYLMEDSRFDISSFTSIAPTAGFFTYGEFDSANAENNVLNATVVSVAMSEQPLKTEISYYSPRELDDRIFATSQPLQRLKRLMNFVSRISEQLETANRELEKLADNDALTGIANRRTFDRALRSETEKANRFGDPLSLIIFDIDHFKQVNDQFGHPVGDHILKLISELVTNSLPASAVFARFGGEEFIILLPDTEITAAQSEAEQLRQLIDEETQRLKSRFQPAITCSFGVCGYEPRFSIEEFIAISDAALYEAKQSGRNRVVVAQPPDSEDDK